MKNYIIGIVLLATASCKKIDVVDVVKREGHMALTTSVLFERKVIIEGDSWSSKTTPALKWPYHLKDSSKYFANAPVINYARPGDNVAWMVQQYDTSVHLSAPTWRTNDYWFFIYAGINDLMGLRRPADTIYANLKKIWIRARADGYKVVAFTVCHSLFLLPSQEVERLKLNEKIKASRTLYDKCIDVAAVFDPRITPYWFANETHLNWDGYRKFAGVVADAFKNQLFLKGGKVE